MRCNNNVTIKQSKMKTNILKVAIIAGITSFGLMACNETPKDKELKVEEAQENLEEAQQTYEQTTSDSINEHAAFVKETEMNLQANDEKIAALKMKMTSEKKDMKIKYEKKIKEIEDRNNKIKNNLKEHDQDNQSNWSQFKDNVNKEMDEIGKSISEMAQKNLEKND